jgi:hypothetical protein
MSETPLYIIYLTHNQIISLSFPKTSIFLFVFNENLCPIFFDIDVMDR